MHRRQPAEAIRENSYTSLQPNKRAVCALVSLTPISVHATGLLEFTGRKALPHPKCCRRYFRYNSQRRFTDRSDSWAMIPAARRRW